MNREWTGFRWDIISGISNVITILWATFVVLSVIKSWFGKTFIAVAVVVAILLVIFSIILFLLMRRIGKLEERVFDCHRFERGLVDCLTKSTKTLNPRTVFDSCETYWNIQSNGDLLYSEKFILSNGGPGLQPIHWLRWSFNVDDDDPGIRNVDQLQAIAHCLDPEGVSVLLHVEKENERKVQLYFIFPEPIRDIPVEIFYQIRWPNLYKAFLKKKKKETTFEFWNEPDSPREYLNYHLEVEFPPSKHNRKFGCTRNRAVGEFHCPNENDERLLLKRQYYSWWKFVPEYNENYRIIGTIK